MKRVVIDIDPSGNCSIDGQEFSGIECAHFIQEIEESIGERISIKDKPEYLQRQAIRQRDRQCEGR